MARPTKSQADRRDHTIRFRVTAAELTQFRQAAAISGFSVSDFVRVKAITSLPFHRKPTPERAAFIRALAELGKVGSNLNQIARSLNRRDASGNTNLALDCKQLTLTLDSTDALTNLLIKMIEHGH